MMTKRFLIAFTLITSTLSIAQPYKTVKVYKPYKWMFGLSWNAAEDDGHKFDGLFDINNNWSTLHPFPTRFTVDRYFNYGWSVEGALSYASYTEETRVNDTTGIAGMNLSFDASAKYSFYNLYAPGSRWIEPYLIAGVGYTYRDNSDFEHVPTLNVGGGLNLWFFRTKQVGIQLASRAKLSGYPFFWDSHANYIQYSAGILYRTKSTRRNQPSKKKRHKWTKKTQKFKRKGGH